MLKDGFTDNRSTLSVSIIGALVKDKTWLSLYPRFITLALGLVDEN